MGPNLYYLILLLVLLLTSFILTSRGRGNEVWRAARWWVLIFGAAIVGAAFWPDIQPRVMSVLDPAGGQRIGSRLVFRKSDDGHFYARAAVNGMSLTFAIDTGTSTIALSKADAARAGINVSALTFNGISLTANGRVPTADVRLERITLGGQTFTDVGAIYQRMVHLLPGCIQSDIEAGHVGTPPDYASLMLARSIQEFSS